MSVIPQVKKQILLAPRLGRRQSCEMANLVNNKQKAKNILESLSQSSSYIHTRIYEIIYIFHIYTAIHTYTQYIPQFHVIKPIPN